MNDIRAEVAMLRTEQVRPDLADLDTRSSREVVDLMAEEDATVAPAVAAVSAQVTEAVDVIVDRLRRGGRLFYVGAGTPGRLGLLDAAECPPTFGTDPGLVVAVMAGGPQAATTAVEGAEDDTAAAERDLRSLDVGEIDVVVAITASGRTPYALGAVAAGRAAGAATIGISNNPESRLSTLVDVAIEVDTGPEVIAGSTRLKAGTAQKLLLNTLSAATMVRLGKTFGNLMVDLRATNAKLEDRSQRIVQEATGIGADEATAALAAADGHVKSAIVSVLARVTAAEARDLLASSASSSVRDAIRGGGSR